MIGSSEIQSAIGIVIRLNRPSRTLDGHLGLAFLSWSNGKNLYLVRIADIRMQRMQSMERG